MLLQTCERIAIGVTIN